MPIPFSRGLTYEIVAIITANSMFFASIRDYNLILCDRLRVSRSDFMHRSERGRSARPASFLTSCSSSICYKAKYFPWYIRGELTRLSIDTLRFFWHFFKIISTQVSYFKWLVVNCLIVIETERLDYLFNHFVNTLMNATITLTFFLGRI